MNAWEPIEFRSSPMGPKFRLSWFGNQEIRWDRLQLFLPPDPHCLLSRHFPFLAHSRSLLTLSLCTLSLFSRSFSPFFHQTLFKFSGSSSNRTSHSFLIFYPFILIHSFIALCSSSGLPLPSLSAAWQLPSMFPTCPQWWTRITYETLCTFSSLVSLYWPCALF